MHPKTFPLQLAWAKMVAPGVRHLAFTRVNAGPLPFIPGQFITLHIEHDNKILNRSYSLATLQGQSDLLEIAASYVEGGPASELLFSIQPGDTLEASGPFGRLILQPEIPKRYFLVATGTGVTPYRAMLPQISTRLSENPTLEVNLGLGVRCREHLLYGDEFNAFQEKHPRFHFFVCYSREFPENPQSFEHQGRVNKIFNLMEPNPGSDIVYLCGNPNMIDEAFAYLKEKGFPVTHVKREKYISTG